ncbi:S-adenosyl-L-methionine-dependent methyltransferase [Ustulina deusta]|nr:S-adenosyl-L-methionine-dependent methyltransferase [Ustulina deusta]
MSSSSSTLSARTTEAVWGLADPWLFLAVSASFLPATIRQVFATHDVGAGLRILLLSPARFREAWFGQFWAAKGPQVREGAGARVLPLLDGRATGGRVVDAPAGPGVGGVVLEIGPATGLWVDVFSDRHLYEDEDEDDLLGGARRRRRANTARSEITRVYGVEPNAAHHAALRRAVKAAGLQDVYEIVPVGIEDLAPSSSSSSSSSSSDNGERKKKKDKKKKWEGSIGPASVDCIVSVLCLCSIPDPQRHVRELYELLRPGGRWYVYEHVRVEYSWYMRLYQRFVNLVWPHLVGGCELCRPTEKTLRETGPWAKIDIGHPPEEMWFHTLPHILGVFTK